MGYKMRNEMLLVLLGEEDLGVLHVKVADIRSICQEIRSLFNSQRNVCVFLQAEAFYPKRIEVSSEVIENIKTRLDIRCNKDVRYEDYENEINEIRNYLISIFSNLKEMSSAISNNNDALLNQYNINVLETLECINS
jgi:prefoldin subunit 5